MTFNQLLSDIRENIAYITANFNQIVVDPQLIMSKNKTSLSTPPIDL